VFSPDHGATTQLLDLPLSAVVKVRRRELQGSNLLEAHTVEGSFPLVRYTDARADAIDQVAEAIRGTIGATADEEEEEKGPPPHEGEGPQRKKAELGEQWGGPIPRGVGVCPECIDRRQLMVRLLHRARPYWKPIAMSFGMAVIATATDIYQAGS